MAENRYSYLEMKGAVEFVLSRRGILHEDFVEDEQSLSQFQVYTVGQSEDGAFAVVLIGSAEDKSFKLDDVGTDMRPHKLIAPQEIIDEIKAELKRERFVA